MWGFLYFSMIVYWGWFTLRDSRWLPSFIGGRNPNATIAACYENLLYIDTPPGVHCYSLFSFGYHVLAFFNHLRSPKQADWREVFLQHIHIMVIYPSFFFSNLMGIGVVIAWLCDITDVFFNLCRFLNAFNQGPMMKLTYTVLIMVWFYTRLIIQPIYIYKIATEARYPEAVSHFLPLVWILLASLTVLALIHVYWFVQILIVHPFKKSVLETTQSSSESGKVAEDDGEDEGEVNESDKKND